MRQHQNLLSGASDTSLTIVGIWDKGQRMADKQIDGGEPLFLPGGITRLVVVIVSVTLFYFFASTIWQWSFQLKDWLFGPAG
jgi:hypothetical protein